MSNHPGSWPLGLKIPCPGKPSQFWANEVITHSIWSPLTIKQAVTWVRISHENILKSFSKRTRGHLIWQMDTEEKAMLTILHILYWLWVDVIPKTLKCPLGSCVRGQNYETQVINTDLLQIHLQLGPLATFIIRSWQNFHPHQLSYLWCEGQ